MATKDKKKTSFILLSKRFRDFEILIYSFMFKSFSMMYFCPYDWMSVINCMGKRDFLGSPSYQIYELHGTSVMLQKTITYIIQNITFLWHCSVRKLVQSFMCFASYKCWHLYCLIPSSLDIWVGRMKRILISEISTTFIEPKQIKNQNVYLFY